MQRRTGSSAAANCAKKWGRPPQHGRPNSQRGICTIARKGNGNGSTFSMSIGGLFKAKDLRREGSKYRLSTLPPNVNSGISHAQATFSEQLFENKKISSQNYGITETA